MADNIGPIEVALIGLASVTGAIAARLPAYFSTGGGMYGLSSSESITR